MHLSSQRCTNFYTSRRPSADAFVDGGCKHPVANRCAFELRILPLATPARTEVARRDQDGSRSVEESPLD